MELSTASTDITIPIDYDTDALRMELTMFGAAPGPILKSTKRLYVKRLLKFKRNTELATLMLAAKQNRLPGNFEFYRLLIWR